jgi:hypothetical protein
MVGYLYLKIWSNFSCGSGCQDCVWIQYADAIHKYFEDYPQLKTPEKWNKVQNLLRHNIEDVNYRAYIEMEMKSKFFSKD